jgi:hypothetical protein
MLVRLKVTLTLEGPVLSRSTAPGSPGLDSPVARNEKGRPMLPFSLVQGRLRQAWEEIGGALDIDQRRIDDLLGKASGDARGDWLPRAGRLAFSDFEAGQEGGSHIDTSVSLDDARHAAEEGALRHLEIPFLPGEQIPFQGEIRFLARDEGEAGLVARHVEQGLRWIPFYGSERSVGFGRAAGLTIQRLTEPLPEPAPEPESPSDRLPLVLTFKNPFCLAQHPEGGNLFEGSEVVPGGALKGTLARAIRLLFGLGPGAEIAGNLPQPFVEMGRHFDRLRFTHAFPCERGRPRPAVIPRSTVAVKGKGGTEWCDVALCPGPVLIDGRAPTFAIDWKDEQLDEIRKRFAWPEVGRELRLRTAIARDQRRAADERLFGYESVLPGQLVWRADVDLGDIPEAERIVAAAQLRSLLKLGFQSVGKTSAEAEVAIGLYEPEPPLPPSLVVERGDRVWVVTLQTPTLLGDPDELAKGMGDGPLFAAYAAAWREISGGELSLCRFFSEERLAGGYQTERFRRARGNGGETSYRPYFLTEAGSVFVLKAKEDEMAGKLLAGWRRHGLPLPDWARARYGNTWRSNPFTPQDGYGEIAVNLAWHLDHRPQTPEELPWKCPSAT